jgi:rhodanese-related sulfurtransferase
MSRRLALVAALAISVSSLAACGSDGADAPADTDASAEAAAAPAGGIVTVPAAEAAALLAEQTDLTIIDVRTPDEFAAGHLANATNIDVEAGSFADEIAALDPAKTYAVYCHSGRRSAIAAQLMADAGFTTIYDLGGVVDLQAAGIELVTG